MPIPARIDRARLAWRALRLFNQPIIHFKNLQTYKGQNSKDKPSFQHSLPHASEHIPPPHRDTLLLSSFISLYNLWSRREKEIPHRYLYTADLTYSQAILTATCPCQARGARLPLTFATAGRSHLRNLPRWPSHSTLAATTRAQPTTAAAGGAAGDHNTPHRQSHRHEGHPTHHRLICKGFMAQPPWD